MLISYSEIPMCYVYLCMRRGTDVSTHNYFGDNYVFIRINKSRDVKIIRMS